MTFLIFAGAALLFQYVWLGLPPPILTTLGLAAFLVALTWSDLRSMTLPDRLTIPLAICGVGVVAINWPDLLRDHLIAAAAWGIALWVMSEAIYRWTGRDALGLGDVKLIAASALWLGPAVSQAIILGSIAGLGYGVIKRSWGTKKPFPFGPFLCLGVWVIWSWSGFGPLGML